MTRQFWYMSPKEGEKFASVGCSDWNDTSSELTFEELGYVHDDDWIHFYAFATKFTDIQDFNNKNWKFEPGFIKFKVAKHDYQKENKEKQKVDVKQSELEKWINLQFPATLSGAIFSGFISLKTNPYHKMLLENKDHTGKELVPEMANMLMAGMLTLTLIEEPTKIKPEDIALPQGKGGFKYGGAKGQTELEKLNDRVAFLCDQINKCGEATPVTNVYEICTIHNFSKQPHLIAEVLKTCTSLMQ